MKKIFILSITFIFILTIFALSSTKAQAVGYRYPYYPDNNPSYYYGYTNKGSVLYVGYNMPYYYGIDHEYDYYYHDLYNPTLSRPNRYVDARGYYYEQNYPWTEDFYSY